MLRDRIDHFMYDQNQRIFTQVPSAMHLIDQTQPLNTEYYLRHRVETVKRIWMTSQTDALALAEMIDEDYDAARLWSKYLTQELNHDLLYLSDLKKHGYRLQQVALTPPFASTVSMVEYLKSSISGIGSIAAVAYSVWVEWNSDVASSIVVKRAQKAFSPGHVKGANAHTMIDVNEDHYEVMVTIIEKLLKRGADETVFFQILYDLSTFFIQYFRDLEKASMLITG